MNLAFTKKEKGCIAAIAVFTVLFLTFLALFPHASTLWDADTHALLEIAVSRLLGGTIFLFLIVYLGYPLLSPRRIRARALVLSLPALVIAVNNFPLLGLIGGTVWVNGTPARALLLVLACFGIGYFEEIAFRGVIFPALLERTLAFVKRRGWWNMHCPPETVAVFLSIVATSAVFGLVHALNLFAGGSPVGVLMQIGYSFLIGGMCAIVLLKTRCTWVPVAIHALYDLGGMLIRYLGGGTLWDTPTVVLTVVVSIVVAVYFLVLLFRMKPEEVRGLLSDRGGAMK